MTTEQEQQIAQLAADWRRLELMAIRQHSQVAEGTLGFGGFADTERQRNAALDALRTAVDEQEER